MRSWIISKKPVLWFGLKFGLLMALLYGLLLVPACEQLLLAYLQLNAWLANAILNLLGQGSHVSGVTISSPKFAMAIRRGCDAVEPTWLLCAAMLSYPARWTDKFTGMAIGAVALQALNLARMVSLYFVGVYLPSFFNSVHLEIWPTVFILVAIILMTGWINWTKRHAVAP